MRRVFLAAAGLAACGKGRAGPEAQIAKDLAAQLGAPVRKVTCPEGALPKTCTADVDGTPLPVTLREDGGELVWDLDGFVISTRPLAAEIAAELDDLGVTADIDCGATYRLTQVGDRLVCALHHDGVDGAAFVRVLDDHAHVDIELALDPAAVAARTGAADPAELEQLSRSLDRDDDEGSGDDEPDDDAGLPR